MIENLIAIWKRVLGKHVIRPGDDFFDLGGTPDAARTLFVEIARELGCDLSPVLIFQAPTISLLAGLLKQAEAPEVEPLLLLKKSSGGPPIFLGHGLGSTVMDLFQLSQQMQCPSPIYGMQARGIDGRYPPFRRIEELAEYHLESIRKLQPDGPYFLIGYSLAGLVCIEIARRLVESGQRVALLAALDSWPDIRHLRFQQQVRLVLQRTKEKTLSLLRSGKLRATWPSVQTNRRSAANPRMTPAMAAAFEHVKAAQYEALRMYKPSYYDGKIVFVRAGSVFHFPDNPSAVWKPLVRELELYSLPCDHPSMLTTHAGALGQILSKCLDDTVSLRQGS